MCTCKNTSNLAIDHYIVTCIGKILSLSNEHSRLFYNVIKIGSVSIILELSYF